MDFMNAFYVYAAAHLAQATGGIQMNISDQQSYNKYDYFLSILGIQMGYWFKRWT